MGIPMGLQYSITAIGCLILQAAVNTLGAVSIAAMTAGGKVGNLMCCPLDAMGSTMATYGGQNLGAGRAGSDSQRPEKLPGDGLHLFGSGVHDPVVLRPGAFHAVFGQQ